MSDTHVEPMSSAGRMIDAGYSASLTSGVSIEVIVSQGARFLEHVDAAWQALTSDNGNVHGVHPVWLPISSRSLGHVPYLIRATNGGREVGCLPLQFVASRLFGRFLVSLPYINTAGIVATSPQVANTLLERAISLADELDVRYLELRHELEYVHPALTHRRTSKVHMRLALPGDANALWNSLKPKVRNQVRKGESCGLTVHWGGVDQLREFYDVFARNMRDLGTPVYGKRLFQEILTQFADQAELCVVRQERTPIAGALLIHGPGKTEVPSASSLRAYNATCANMLMYWHLLKRAIERGQGVFDFGRSSEDSNTYRFKKQWGAQPSPAIWQYYVRRGDIGDMRPENEKYQRMIRIWQRLPVWLTRLIGPAIVRGIP